VTGFLLFLICLTAAGRIFQMGPLGIPELIIIVILLLIPTGLVIGIVVVAKLVSRGGKRQCPYCEERIDSAAALCTFCGRDVTAPID